MTNQGGVRGFVKTDLFRILDTCDKLVPRYLNAAVRCQLPVRAVGPSGFVGLQGSGRGRVCVGFARTPSSDCRSGCSDRNETEEAPTTPRSWGRDR